jgi:uncharacterized integral membrane protein
MLTEPPGTQTPVTTEATPGRIRRRRETGRERHATAADPSRRPVPDRARTASAALLTIVGAVAAVLAVVAVVQNSDDVRLEFLAWSLTAPLAVVLVLALILGAIVALAVRGLREHRRRRAPIARGR